MLIQNYNIMDSNKSFMITWKHIVEKMESKFGISPNNTELFSMAEIEAYIEDIWDDFFHTTNESTGMNYHEY